MEIAMGIAILIYISIMMYARHIEKRHWNNGICRKCGKPWEHFDTDSQGGRMYQCDNGHGCDISYNVDKRK